MFYEVQPYDKIKLEEISGYAINPNTNDYLDRKMYVYLKGSRNVREFLFSTREECRRAYEALDKALTAMDAPNHVRMIMD